MARTRRAPRPTHQQTPLTFGPLPTKITKPSLPTPSSSSKRAPSSQEPRSPALILPTEPISPIRAKDDVPSAAPMTEREGEGIQEMVEEKKKEMIDEIEERAKRVREVDVRRYWRGKEEERKARRVHQESLSLHEKILRHFDLSSQYGPCIGIPRLSRWKRAQNLHLDPPIEVLAVLLMAAPGGDKNGGNKKDGTGRKKAAAGQTTGRAYVEGLLGGGADGGLGND